MIKIAFHYSSEITEGTEIEQYNLTFLKRRGQRVSPGTGWQYREGRAEQRTDADTAGLEIKTKPPSPKTERNWGVGVEQRGIF